jgi:signal transduction histidine kinase
MVSVLKRIIGTSLRQRIRIFSILVFLAIVIVSYALISTVVKNKFTELESIYTITSANRAFHALNEDIYNLRTTGTDWAAWDDTYAFVENPTQAYIEANLVDEMLMQINLNFIVLLDTSGKVVFEKAIDLEEKIQIPLPIMEYLTPGSLLLSPAGIDSTVSGILVLPDNPMIITAQPILTSRAEGPIHGTLIMGRYLDAAKIKNLEDRVQMPITIEEASKIELPDGFWQEVEAAHEDPPVIVQPLDKDTVAGYVTIEDIFNEPSLVLKVSLPRDIYQQGLASTALLSMIIVVFITISLWIVVWIIDWYVLRRLSQVDNAVKRIDTAEGTLFPGFKVTGNDELTHLVTSISDMLTRLNDTKSKLQYSERNYRELFIKSQQQYENEKTLRHNVEEEINKRIEFTRALVHELKTPITPILVALELLQESIKDERLLQLLQSMDRSATHLNNRINELLDLARAETNRLEINVETVNIKTLCQQVGQTMGVVALQKEQKLLIEIPERLPFVTADNGRLRQVVANLLTNAIKFTPSGGTITLKARQENDKVHVEIHDTGPGISEEDQKRLFEPYHLRIGDKERLSGLGLGLALSKKFIELQGGEIFVNSRLGKGSTFGFTLPIRNSRKESAKELPGKGI